MKLRQLVVVASWLVLVIACEYRAPVDGQSRIKRAPVNSAGIEKFRYVTDVLQIPTDGRVALAEHFGQVTLQLAEPGAPYNVGCLVVPDLPRRRLLLAAVSADVVVVHYEEGGFVPVAKIAVIQRRSRGVASVVQEFVANRICTSPDELEKALHELVSSNAVRYSNPRLGV